MSATALQPQRDGIIIFRVIDGASEPHRLMLVAIFPDRLIGIGPFGGSAGSKSSAIAAIIDGAGVDSARCSTGRFPAFY
jgi:hypothetical protein